MIDQNQYKAMMDDIHAPAELLERIKMEPVKSKARASRLTLKYASAMMAAVIGAFGISNGICYAATGETWVEKATVMVNGEPTEMDVKTSTTGDTTSQEITYELEDGSGAFVFETSEGGASDGSDNSDSSSFEIIDYTGKGADSSIEITDLPVKEQNGRVYIAPSGISPIDVTDQLNANGAAIGDYTVNGVTHIYKVTGKKGAYKATSEVK